MDFEHPLRIKELQAQPQNFMDSYLLPAGNGVIALDVLAVTVSVDSLGPSGTMQ